MSCSEEDFLNKTEILAQFILQLYVYSIIDEMYTGLVRSSL